MLIGKEKTSENDNILEEFKQKCSFTPSFEPPEQPIKESKTYKESSKWLNMGWRFKPDKEELKKANVM